MPPVAFRAQKFLAGLRYPATKDQILQRARQRGADEDVMLALYALPERPFESPVHLSSEIARQIGRLPPAGS